MKLSKITMACNDISQMVEFYSNVFEVSFKEHEWPGFKMYSTKIGDINFLFCPNEIAGVVAEQNRHQFDYLVDDINKTVEAGLSSGGSIHSELQKNEKESFVTLFDPDNNTINFIQVN